MDWGRFCRSYVKEENAKLPEKSWFDTRTLIQEMPLTAAQAADAAKNTDIAIITIGKSAGEGADRLHDEYYLTEAEMKMIETVTKTFHQHGKKVVVVLNIPGVIETSSWNSMPDAILLAWMGGQETGYAPFYAYKYGFSNSPNLYLASSTRRHAVSRSSIVSSPCSIAAFTYFS